MNHNKQMVSVILAAHNCENFLKKTLQSLELAISNSSKDVEIILINDASTDRTGELLDAFVVKNVNAKKYDVDFLNIGKVRNFGVSRATGQYITMLDGDDQLLPNTISDIIPQLKKTRPDMFITRLNEIRNNDTQGVKWNGVSAQKISQHEAIKTYLIHKDFQAHFIGQFIKSDLLKNNPFPDLYCYEDAYLFPTILKNSENIYFQNNGHYLYFKRENSLSSAVNIDKVKILVKAIEHMEMEFGSKYLHLITCHWINVQHKYGQLLKNDKSQKVVLERLRDVSTLPFIFDFSVRTSFKKKLIKLKTVTA